MSWPTAKTLRRWEWKGGTPRTEVDCSQTHCLYHNIWCA